jgi:hypothetical protein
MQVDLWHPLRAQTTYDALVALVNREFDRFFDHFPRAAEDGLTDTRCLFESIDAVVQTWELLDSTRPSYPLDPDLDWCVILETPKKTQKELAGEYNSLLGTQLTPTTTLRDFLCRRTPEFAQILQHPPAEHRDLLDRACHALGRWVTACDFESFIDVT